MSCFIVGDETLNRAVHLLNWRDQRIRGGYLGDLFNDEHSPEKPIDRGGMYGRAMRELNAQAFTTRYGHNGERYYPNVAPFRWTPKQYSLVEMVKAGQCVLYQCTEGESLQKQPCYIDLEKAIASACGSIVADLPEYDVAMWGD